MAAAGSGDSKMSARHLFQNSKTFIMNVALLIACNNLPNIPTTDDDVNSYLRRIIVVPFYNEYKDDCDQVPYNKENPNHRWKDPKKCRAVKESIAGVLAWAVQGAMKLNKKGRLGKKPETCTKRMEEATADSDWVSNFEFTNDKKDKMKVKEVREYITEHFGAQMAKELQQKQIIEKLKVLGCWHKTVSRVDTMFAIRIRGDTEEPKENQFVNVPNNHDLQTFKNSEACPFGFDYFPKEVQYNLVLHHAKSVAQQQQSTGEDAKEDSPLCTA